MKNPYLLLIIGVLLMSLSVILMKNSISFTVSPGFPCHAVPASGMGEDCPMEYVYTNVSADSAIEILGQVVKFQGGTFELN